MLRRSLYPAILVAPALVLGFAATGQHQLPTAPPTTSGKADLQPQQQHGEEGTNKQPKPAAAPDQKYVDAALRIAALFPGDHPEDISYPKTKDRFVAKILPREFYYNAVRTGANIPPANDSALLLRGFAESARERFEGPDPLLGPGASDGVAASASASAPPPSSDDSELNQAWYDGWLGRLIANTSVTGMTLSGDEDLSRRGSYELLGIRRKSYGLNGDEKIVATFRLILAGSRGVSYHDYIFDSPEKGDGKTPTDTGNNAVPTVVDVYDYQSGEMLSEAFRRDFVLAYGDKVDAGFSPSEQALWGDRENIKTLRKAFRDGSYGQCFDIYNTQLTPTTQADPSLAILWLRAAGNVEFGAFKHAFESLTARKIPPVRNSAVWLISIDRWVRFGDYGRVKECVDMLDGTFGSDWHRQPTNDCYLKILRASISVREGNVGDAQNLLRQVLLDAANQKCSLGRVAAYQAFELSRELSRTQRAEGTDQSAATEAASKLQLREVYTPEERTKAQRQYDQVIERARRSAVRPPE